MPITVKLRKKMLKTTVQIITRFKRVNVETSPSSRQFMVNMVRKTSVCYVDGTGRLTCRAMLSGAKVMWCRVVSVEIKVSSAILMAIVVRVGSFIYNRLKAKRRPRKLSSTTVGTSVKQLVTLISVLSRVRLFVLSVASPAIRVAAVFVSCSVVRCVLSWEVVRWVVELVSVMNGMTSSRSVNVVSTIQLLEQAPTMVAVRLVA